MERFIMSNVKNYFKVGCVLGFIFARYFYIPRNLSCAEQIMNQELSERIIERGFEKYLKEDKEEESFRNVKEALIVSKMFQREELESMSKADLLKKLKKNSKNKKHFLYF
jgi:predicted nucleotidyltransferase